MEQLRTKQVYKFGLYGLLKNLKFFEPFLWLYLLESNLTFLQIGLLYSVKEIIIYVFEIPSGVIADNFGKKNELILCFMFYITSFVVFFVGGSYYIFMLAMVLFGLGEAFRSGTHKAMIMTYLDHEDLTIPKSKIYGLTRSYSNIGLVISSIIGILLYFYTYDIRVLFLIAIVPYVLDLMLIISYPRYFNERIKHRFTLSMFIRQNIESIQYAVTEKELNKLLLESSLFNAVFKTIKDYIQPLILGLTLSYVLFSNLNHDDYIIIVVGLVYAFAQLISVFVSKNAYRLEQYVPGTSILNYTILFMGMTSLLLGAFYQSIVMIVLSFTVFYAILNIRKPFMVEKIGDASHNQKRASVLSIESQLTSLFIVFLAPLLGFISDTYGISIMFISLGLLLIGLNLLKQVFLTPKKIKK